eukprot:Pompholyxophrys_punicea_v1_NODE_496_length_1836_cov_5.268389.p2 type:complete len:110 gc:universal NODE_496_length_1836_cov_5.268389:1361-1690(+)
MEWEWEEFRCDGSNPTCSAVQDRSQFITLCPLMGPTTPLSRVLSGVPQGSVLGPFCSMTCLLPPLSLSGLQLIILNQMWISSILFFSFLPPTSITMPLSRPSFPFMLLN